MHLLIDDANIENIKYLYNYYPVCGVTTNPSILFKNNKNPLETLEEIREFIREDELHIQVLSNVAENIVKEARLLKEKFGSNTFKIIAIKIHAYKIYILSNYNSVYTSYT